MARRLRLWLALAVLVAWPLLVEPSAVCSSDTSLGMGNNGLCSCHEGWSGPSCDICLANDVCPSQLNEANARCSSTNFLPVKHISGWCELGDNINALIHGQGYVQIGYQVKGPSFSFEFWKQATTEGNPFSPIFRCESNQTTVTQDPGAGKVKYNAPDLKCHMTCEVGGSDRICTKFLQGIVEQVGGQDGCRVICEPAKRTCQVHEHTLETWLGAVQTTNCLVSECILPGQEPEVADSTIAPGAHRMPTTQRASLILGSLYVAAFGLVLLVALGYYMQWGGFVSYKDTVKAVGAGDKAGGMGDGGVVTGFARARKTYTLVWDDLRYGVSGKDVLKGVSGVAYPGQLLALMGASGSGKTTLVDILALKRKPGTTTGRLMYNHHRVDSQPNRPMTSSLKEVVGFVDQEDNLKGTLTVFEAVLFSASLRLPGDVPMAVKAQRAVQVLRDLRIAHVADSYIGSQGHRGVSGGEKRRVSVAVELVKIPAVLFLDEPTSGLDSFNASMLVDCLHDLARKSQTTVVMTIHQPRSSVFFGMDRLLVLNLGEMAYYGPTQEMLPFLNSLGHHMPDGHNPADFIIDLLCGSHAMSSNGSGSSKHLPLDAETHAQTDSHATSPSASSSPVSYPQSNGEHYDGEKQREIELTDLPLTQSSSRPLEESVTQSGSALLSDAPGAKTAEMRAAAGAHNTRLEKPPQVAPSTKSSPASGPVQSPVTQLFRDSDRYRSLHGEIETVLRTQALESADVPLPPTTVPELDLAAQGSPQRGRRRQAERATTVSRHLMYRAVACLRRVAPASKALATAVHRWCWEVGVLSRRSMLDLVRNPLLLLTHFMAMVYFAAVIGTVYYHQNMQEFKAVQNRLGSFLLSCVFLTFTSVSSLPLFWLERNLYIHEHSNRFYSRSAYFVVKIFFDLIPLRVIPTIIYGIVTYEMIGLRPGFNHFIYYEAFLVLLVCTASVLNLVIGMLTRNIMSGILIATVAMIHFLMLTSLFVNFDAMSVTWLRWLKRVSFFNYAFDGLSVNELLNRRIENWAVSSGNGILKTVGLALTMEKMFGDMMNLCIYLAVSTALAYLVLVFCVKESR